MNSEILKKLREHTQAGFMDCKKALEAVNYNFDEAVKWLREKGIAKAATKNATKIATEGTTWVLSDASGLALIELNSQTDFTGKSELVLDLAKAIVELILKTKNGKLEDVLKTKLINDTTVEEKCLEVSSKTGEKISLRYTEYLPISGEQFISIYRHHNGKISTYLLFDKKMDVEIAKKIAMHVTVMKPNFIDPSKVSEDWLNKEKEIFKIQFEQELNQMPDGIEKTKKLERSTMIIEGKMKKMLNENCLVSQEFMFEPGITINDLLKKANVKILKMKRLELGEGLEKKEIDFASEVAAQMKK